MASYALNIQRGFMVVLVAAVAWTGCSDSDESAPTTTNPGTSNGSSTTPDYGTGDKTDITQDQEAFLREYEQVREEAALMSPAEFSTRYQTAPRVDELSYDPLTAGNLDSIRERIPMDSQQLELLGQNGFVVLENSDRYTFENAYSDIYFADLPVLITTDSLLYALHRSYDSILQELEKTVLTQEAGSMLEKMHANLKERMESGTLPEAQAEASRDVDVYLAVGRSLLDGETVAPFHDDADTTQKFEKILANIEALSPSGLEMFGVRSDYDYSQMKPRGHYEDDPVLQRYFRTMMWLGRTEMQLVIFEQGQSIFNRTALDSAFLMNSLLQDSDAMAHWEKVDSVITRMVGERDSMNPNDMRQFAESNSLTDLETLSNAEDEKIKSALLSSPYGLQRIMSQIIYTDPNEPQVVLPRVYLLMGQRFTIDSYVFNHVTYDRLKDPKTGKKITRMLPSDLDVQFALGSNAAGALLTEEFEQYPYQGTLHQLRYLVESHPQEFWDSNIYSGWLNALRALNDITDRESQPEAMRTEAWEHKTLNTQMASWAELRHDTLLYAKQSYSGGIGCEYPAAYVEPNVQFYERMGHLAELGLTMASELSAEGFETNRIKAHFEATAGIMSTLEEIARKELAQKPLTEDEWNFLRATIEQEMVGCGEIQYDGWYASLFFDRADLGVFKPTIADVHTAPTDAAGNPVGWVAHAATGATKMMVFTLNNCDGTQAYVGPVSSYYSVLGQDFNRFTDSDWGMMVFQDPIQRPSWASSFAR